MELYKGKIKIASNIKILKSIFSQMVGLRFSKQKNLLFEFKKERKEMIDMLFVFYPIDVIFLDKNKKVTEIKENLRPFGAYRPKNIAKYFIELKAGTIADNKIKVGDQLILKQ